MSFSFDPSKAQGATQPTALSGFGAANTGAGDASKTLGSGFSLPSMQPQAKPTNLFGSTLGSTPAPAFGATPGLSLGAPAPSITTSAPGALTFGATPAASTGLSFGMASSTPGTGFGAPGIRMPGLGSAPSFAAQPAATAMPTALTFGAAKAPATTGFSLGGAPTSTSAPALNLSFGAVATSTPAATGFNLGANTTPASTGISFGLAPATTALTSAPTGLTLGTPASNASLGGAISLTATTSAPPAGTPQGFSLAPTAPASNSSSLSFSLPGTTSTAATSFNLGSTAPTISSGFALNKTTAPATTVTVPSTSAPQTSLGNVTTVTPSSSAQTGSMNFCQLEESINKWTLELEEQEIAFVNQATQVNAWNKLLIANGEKIVLLNEEVERVKLEQQKLEQELDYVVGQQKELQDCLVPLEKELSSLSNSDPEREYTYRLAENLDTQMKQMSEDLKEIIEHLNEANRAQDSGDPIVQIGKILNAHMNSLQWLDQRTSILGQKIQQIDTMHQNYRQDNERSFSLAYN